MAAPWADNGPNQKGTTAMTLPHFEPSRDKSKSPAHSLSFRLTNEVGLNRAQVAVTLDLVDEHLHAYYGKSRGPGVISHTGVSAKEPAGKPIKDCEVLPIELTMMHEADIDVLREHGPVRLRMVRMLRYCEEAREQHSLLSQEDLSHLLAVDPGTVSDYVRRWREEGVFVPTRGAVKDIGPDPSHKRLIATMLARGLSTSQIRATAKHSEGAIGRYQHQFALVLHLLHTYPDASDDERWQLSGLPRGAYDTYVEVYEECRDRTDCQRAFERLRRRFELDPKGLAHELPAGKAPKDLAQKRLEEQNLPTAIRQTIQDDLNTTSCVAEAVTADVMALIEAAFQLPECLRSGEVVVFVDARDNSLLSGENAADRKVIPVRLPLYTEQSQAIWRSDYSASERRARVAVALAVAALEQNAIMSVVKLAELLHVTPSTMGADLRKLAVKCHVEVPTKGLIEDAGPTLTHKDWIVSLDNSGLTGEEITYLTRHAPISRDRYIETYRRSEILMRLEGEIPEPEQLARLLRIRKHVAEQYVQLLRRYHGDGEAARANAATEEKPPPADEQWPAHL